MLGCSKQTLKDGKCRDHVNKVRVHQLSDVYHDAVRQPARSFASSTVTSAVDFKVALPTPARAVPEYMKEQSGERYTQSDSAGTTQVLPPIRSLFPSLKISSRFENSPAQMPRR